MPVIHRYFAVIKYYQLRITAKRNSYPLFFVVFSHALRRNPLDSATARRLSIRCQGVKRRKRKKDSRKISKTEKQHSTMTIA